jgi:uncharacterized membrane protein
MRSPLKGAVIATAVAGLFLAGSAHAGEHEHKAEGKKVKCEGGNACKGQGACGGATHDCHGKNECKGKGWVMLTPEECKEAGGTPK